MNSESPSGSAVPNSDPHRTGFPGPAASESDRASESQAGGRLPTRTRTQMHMKGSHLKSTQIVLQQVVHWNAEMSPNHISKLGGYYIRLKHLSGIIHIKTLLKHIKTLLYQLKLLQFFDYYIILYHMSEINYYINYITIIISINFICVYYFYYIN